MQLKVCRRGVLGKLGGSGLAQRRSSDTLEQAVPQLRHTHEDKQLRRPEDAVRVAQRVLHTAPSSRVNVLNFCMSPVLRAHASTQPVNMHLACLASPQMQRENDEINSNFGIT